MLSRSARYLGIGLLMLACCSDSGGTKPTEDRPDCVDGKRVESEAGAVCVFPRSLALVIEGGFSCPPTLEVRTDLATAVACSARAFDLLPASVCAAIDGACDAAKPGAFAKIAAAHDAGAPGPPRFGGPGECVSATNLGCVDDAECAESIPEPPTVCRTDTDGVARCRDACTEQADCSRGGGERAETAQVDCVDGACTYVGCMSDAQCRSPGVCAMNATGISECAFACEDVADCARQAQQELGLDAPDPHDPFTHEDIFVCRHGLCRIKVLGCSDEADCAAIGQAGAMCELP